MYVRHKVIKGHVYYYLVRGERQGGKVKQKVVRYLGKQPGGFSGSAGGGYTIPESGSSVPADPAASTPSAPIEAGLERNPSKRAAPVVEAVQKSTAPATPTTGTLLTRDEGRRSSDGAPVRYDIVKVKGGISWQYYVNDELKSADFSARPYRLGQPNDGMVDECIEAMFILWCRATGRDAQELYHQAYGSLWSMTHRTFDVAEQDEKLRYAIAEGIDIPTSWGVKEFQGLLDSLAENNRDELVSVLKTLPQPTAPRHVSPSLATAVMNRERARTLVDQALANLSDALAAGKSEALTAYLNAMARFRNYSLSNQLSIAAQCPGATIVAGFREWKKRGRYVRKGEKGILITAPVIRKLDPKSDASLLDNSAAEDNSDMVVGYRPVYVFDVSQTEGEPLPSLEVRQASGDPGQHTDKLKAFVAGLGITLEYTDDLRHGVLGSSSGGRIRIREGLSPVEEFTTLAHEIAHELLHHKPAERAAKTVRETEAEAVAHVVSSAVGLETTGATADYIQLYQGNTETLRASLETIRRTANMILEGLKSDR